ncbi:AraC family transcriptional regulator [Ferruginibacter sp.]
MKLYIKNMACDCCRVLVKEEIEKLGLSPVNIDLGEAEIKEQISPAQKEELNDAIKKAGLEVIEDKRGILLEKIKKVMYDYTHHYSEKQRTNFSTYLSKQLHYDYSYLANFFSEMQATTIEQYLISLKIDKVKELLVLSDLTLTQIADELQYSSVAHLSAQFKKVTGLTPTHFKQLKEKRQLVKVG